MKEMTELFNLSNQMKLARDRMRLTQEGLGELTDLAAATISSIERCEKAPSFESLFKIVDVIQLDTRKIFPYPLPQDPEKDHVYRRYCELGKYLSVGQLLAVLRLFQVFEERT